MRADKPITTTNFLTILAAFVLAVAAAFIITQGTPQLILVDSECKDAQRQYYIANERAIQNQNEDPSGQHSQRNQAHEHADLCAQNRMAKAAELGLWLLFFTFVFTAVAAVAAWQTVNVMRHTSQRELRAYILPEVANMEVAEDRGAPRIRVEFMNRGQTPAYDVALKFAIITNEKTEALAEIPDDAEVYLHGVIGPGKQFFFLTPLIPDCLDIRTWDRVTKGELAVVVYGWLSYLDTFRNQHITEFAYYYRVDEFDNPERQMFVYPNGWNAAT